MPASVYRQKTYKVDVSGLGILLRYGIRKLRLLQVVSRVRDREHCDKR